MTQITISDDEYAEYLYRMLYMDSCLTDWFLDELAIDMYRHTVAQYMFTTYEDMLLKKYAPLV